MFSLVRLWAIITEAPPWMIVYVMITEAQC